MAPPLWAAPVWFPDFGVEYGVFATKALAGAPAYGWLYPCVFAGERLPLRSVTWMPAAAR